MRRTSAAWPTRSGWRTYVESLQIDQSYPGIQGIGFAKRIPPAELDRHERQVRAEGFPAYQVRPPGKRDEYAPVIFLEPFSGRNLRSFGFDMLSEPVRREAKERAHHEPEDAHLERRQEHEWCAALL